MHGHILFLWLINEESILAKDYVVSTLRIYYTGTFHVKYKWNNDELSELFSCDPKNSGNTVNDTIIIIKKLCIYSKNKLNIIKLVYKNFIT